MVKKLKCQSTNGVVIDFPHVPRRSLTGDDAPMDPLLGEVAN
jgi:hypothetical protein